MPQGFLTWELPAREPEPPAPTLLAVAAYLVMAALAVELGAMSYLFLKLV